MIRRIVIQGFKSFEDTEFVFHSPLVVLLGPGGAGKSNLLETFAFLKETIIGEASFSGEEIIRGSPTEMFCMHKPTNEIRIAADIVTPESLCLRYAVFVSLSVGGFGFPVISSESLSVLENNDTWFSVFTRDENVTIVLRSTKQRTQLTEKGPVSQLCFVPEIASLVNEVRGWHFHNLLPQQMYGPSPLGLSLLGVTGTNLASAYRYMSAQKDKYELITSAWAMIYPHIAIETRVDNSGMVHLYFRDDEKVFPARLVSNAMLYWLAIIMAISQDARVVAIEEPSAGIAPEHLYMLSEVLKVASREKQIFITTRSPLVADAIGGECISL